MSIPPTLAWLYRGLEALYQRQTDVDLGELVRLHDGELDGAQERLYLRETDDGALEVALLYDRALLAGLDPQVLVDDARLPHAWPVVEGLSHLCYLAEAARRERPISGLELETQAEVDKLAMTVLARWPTPPEAFDRLVDRLYYGFSLRDMSPALADRYHTANRIALGFSRRLRPYAVSRRLADLRRTLREFWGGGMNEKHALSR